MQKHPGLASIFRQLDWQFAQMGTAEVIRPDELASLLSADRNQMRSALEILALEGVLCHVELIECRYCQMPTFVSDYEQAIEEEGEYRCTSCDRPLTQESIRSFSAYRYGEHWPVPNSKDNQGVTRSPLRNAGTVLEESGWYTHATLAQAFNVGSEALRKRLDRYRERNVDGWKVNDDRQRREPRYLYQYGAVKSAIEELRASAGRPPK